MTDIETEIAKCNFYRKLTEMQIRIFKSEITKITKDLQEFESKIRRLVEKSNNGESCENV